MRPLDGPRMPGVFSPPPQLLQAQQQWLLEPQHRGSLDTGFEALQAVDVVGSRGISAGCDSSKPPEVVIDTRLAALIVEFARAVVPLCAFIGIYCKVAVGVWVLDLHISGGLLCVIAGLAVFKYGLVTGLMPLGRSIGRRLVFCVPLAVFLGITCALGVLITFAEPGINSLQEVGKIMEQREGPVQALLLEHSFGLLNAIATGVGMAATVGVLRLKERWSMKPVVLFVCVPTVLLTAACWFGAPELRPVVGIAWDAGAITTGPATVPIVVAIGLGIAHSAREHATSEARKSLAEEPPLDTGASEIDGFGIVTLASLFPVCTVLTYTLLLSWSGALDNNGITPSPTIYREPDLSAWEKFPMLQVVLSLRAVLPVTIFLLGVQYLLIREALEDLPRVLFGIGAVLCGLFIFNIGLSFGSVPLGKAAGEVLPLALDEYGAASGPVFVFAFGFVAGFIATVVDLEPCGLGETVEELSQGKFKKWHLFGSVATGVGAGIILGFCKLLYELDILMVLCIGYTIALSLTAICDEGLATIAWDSAGVTTGPVTVPLVLSVGAGIANKAHVNEGFGILACASVCPIISVLVMAIVVLGPHEPDVFRRWRARGARAVNAGETELPGWQTEPTQ
eukprot:NODE_2153_length_2281_cov_10.695450.p1 GENE.NODE_2153_length_2281_cov_10.695450~~NODE_2153_length_2281_cov_10.695450.p1  ORF type:complete len:623 (+),score=171.21 NODE_2153_length_2281_cov_10.695450:157-2025(+)